MNELDAGITSEELRQKLFTSIEMVKKFKKIMKEALYFIKRNYTAYTYLHEFIGSDYFENVTARVKCELQFDLKTKKLTMQSLIDPDLKKSTRLFSSDEQWLNFIEQELQKKKK